MQRAIGIATFLKRGFRMIRAAAMARAGAADDSKWYRGVLNPTSTALFQGSALCRGEVTNKEQRVRINGCLMAVLLPHDLPPHPGAEVFLHAAPSRSRGASRGNELRREYCNPDAGDGCARKPSFHSGRAAAPR